MQNILSNTKNETISIKDAANLASVSTATIRNWIKTNYLVVASNGQVTQKSLDYLLNKIIGKEKLVARANKTMKDKQDNEKIELWLEKKIKQNDNIDQISQEYEQQLSDSFKNKEGIYYTPQNVIENMFDEVDFERDMTFLDPACGTGNFIIKAIEKGIKPENIYGFDTDKNAVKIAIERIYLKTGYKSNNIKVANFLDFAINNEFSQKYDLIFTNPPWGKKISKSEKNRYGKLLNAKNSLDTTSLFLFAALKLLKKNGILGFLIQEAFYNISSFEEIRKEILKYNIIRIVDYGKVFKGLLTKAQAIILQNNFKEENSIKCEINEKKHYLSKQVFKKNHRTIFNFWVKNEDIKVIDMFFNKKHITLKNNAKWGLGIVTGNNKKFCVNEQKMGYIPVFKGADITRNGLKSPTCYIPMDFSKYQQVAPIELYEADEKLIYRFISSKLIFFYDDKQRFILNSANFLIPNKELGITPKQLSLLLNSKIMNWIFKKLFNTHKILRGDLETLPLHVDYFKQFNFFDEKKFLYFLNIKEVNNGTFRV